MSQWDKTVFSGAAWGPAHLDLSPIGGSAVTVGDSRSVKVTWSGMKTNNVAPHGYLEQGVPVLVDGVQVAVAAAKGWAVRFFCKPGRIRIEGDLSEFVTPGLHVKGHVMPQRMTLADDEGKLVWSRAFSGALNLRSGPLLLVRPKVSVRATPEHIALWLACYTLFETAY